MEDKYGYEKYRLDKSTLPNKPITYDNIEELGFYTNYYEGWTLFHDVAEYITEDTENGVSKWCQARELVTFHDFADYIDRRIAYLTEMRDKRGF